MPDAEPTQTPAPLGYRMPAEWEPPAATWLARPHRRDDRLPAFVAEQLGLRSWQPRVRGWRVVLEGGSIDVNGQGLMLTTEECLLSKTQARNPPLDRADYEQLFADYLGVKKVLWLGR